MKTQIIIEADTRFLGGIGLALVAATMAVGLVLLASIPPNTSSNIMSENPSKVMLVDLKAPVLTRFDLPDQSNKEHGSLNGTLIRGSVN